MSLSNINSSLNLNNFINNAVAAPAVTNPALSAPASSPALDDLTKLLSDPAKLYPPAEMNTAEKAMYDQLSGIDGEMTFMGAQLDQLNKMSQQELEEDQTVLELLNKLEQRLQQIKLELENIYKDNKDLAAEERQQQARMDQVGILKKQIDDARALQKDNEQREEDQGLAGAEKK
jgi:hypothetical protein